MEAGSRVFFHFVAAAARTEQKAEAADLARIVESLLHVESVFPRTLRGKSAILRDHIRLEVDVH